MASKFGLGGVNLTGGGDPGDADEVPEGLPFRLLVCGDFSGSSPQRTPLDKRKPVAVDRDNFEEVLARFAPQMNLPWEGSPDGLVVRIGELEDFEPDRLLSRLPVFEELRALLRQLGQPRTFEDAAAKVRSWTNAPAEARQEPAAAPAKRMAAADILQDILESRAPAEVPSARSEWDQFLQRVVQPHLVERPDPRQADYEAVVEEAISVRLRTILHHPDFQALERAWRSLHLLVRRLNTDENLNVFLFDLRADEIDRDLGQDDPRQAVFFREVVQKTVGTAGGRPWAAVVSLETFGATEDDLQRLGKMVAVASLAKAPVLAGASTRLVGCDSLPGQPAPDAWRPEPRLAQTWEAIRSLPEAHYLGVVAPRFPARLPYGKGAARVESFAFEELPAGSSHEHYLWAPGSVLAALLLGEGFAESGWAMNPNDMRTVRGLPVHVYDDDGERAMKPCAEVMLRDKAFERLVDAGLMVLISERDRDAVQLARFQSAARGPSRLAGRWGG